MQQPLHEYEVVIDSSQIRLRQVEKRRVPGHRRRIETLYHKVNKISLPRAEYVKDTVVVDKGFPKRLEDIFVPVWEGAEVGGLGGPAFFDRTDLEPSGTRPSYAGWVAVIDYEFPHVLAAEIALNEASAQIGPYDPVFRLHRESHTEISVLVRNPPDTLSDTRVVHQWDWAA